MKNILKVNKCLISVSDKSDIVKFAKSISAKKIDIVSTGNTYKKLKQEGIKVKKVESITKFPEILEGRVKTLHPKIFGGILGDVNNVRHLKDMQNHKLEKFELVIVNLYPFEKVIEKTNNIQKCIENIDVGGPSMIRGAAKNYNSTAVVIDKNDYKEILMQIKNYGGLTLDLRKKLAYKAFYRTMQYDTKISVWMSRNILDKEYSDLLISASKPNKLRYGENPHQAASFYSTTKNKSTCFEKLNGKELSYNNLNDLKLGLKLTAEFSSPTCVIIKHAIPSSVSESKDIKSAWDKAYMADSLSAFGGVVIFNKKLDEQLARKISKVFLEVIVAPSYTEKALKILRKKINLRIIKIKNIIKLVKTFKKDITFLPGGVLVQEVDKFKVSINKLKVVTNKAPSKKEKEDLVFAYKVVKHVRSNAIVIAKNKTTVGIGSGNTSRVDSVQFAIIKAKRSFSGKRDNLLGAVMASDAFFPFSDSIKIAAKANIKAIIQPGGSISDNKVIEETDKEKISMVFTGKRCFSHL